MSTTVRPAHLARSSRTTLISAPVVAGLLVVGALLDTLEPIIRPLTGSTTADDLAVIVAHQDAFVVSKLVGLVGTLLLLPGLLGLMAHTVHRAPVASRVAAGLAVLGLMSFMGIRFGSAVELQTLREGMSMQQGGLLMDHLGSNPLAVATMVPFLLATLLGMVAVAVALWRAGFPRTAAVLVGLFPVADMGLEGHAPGWAAHVLLLAGMVLVARHLLTDRT